MKIYKLSKVLRKAQVLTPDEYLTFCTQIDHIVDDRVKITNNSSVIGINIPGSIFWLDDVYMDSGRLINMTEPGAYVELHDVFAVNTKTGAVWAVYHFMGWKSKSSTLIIPTSTAEALDPRGYTYWIHKPALENTTEVVKFITQQRKKLVITSYLDHPLGNYFALFNACQLMGEEFLVTCGLNSFDFYEVPTFVAPPIECSKIALDTNELGLGMTNYLKNLQWEILKN
jgi:hypothetical protein